MVDGTGLENQQVNSLASSNLVPSARYLRRLLNWSNANK